MVRHLYIVRHGNTFDPGDTPTRVGARTDLALSKSGHVQAEALARHFAGIALAGAMAGPLARTRQTAETILAAQEQPGPPRLEIAEFLREIDYGPDENRPESEVIARIGETALREWDEAAIPPPGWQVDPLALITAWHELFRALAGLPHAGPALAVTSNGIARFALSAADEVASGTALKLKTGAYGRVAILPDGRARMEDWNLRP